MYQQFQRLDGTDFCTLWRFPPGGAGNTPEFNDSALFGSSVSMSDDCLKLVVGAPWDYTKFTDSGWATLNWPAWFFPYIAYVPQGAAYIFSRETVDDGFTLSSKLVSDNLVGMSHYGQSCIISSDGLTVAIGAPQNGYTVPFVAEQGPRNGAVFIYHYEAGEWVEQIQLVPDIEDISFGNCLLFNGDADKLLVMGLDSESPIWYYRLESGSWTFQRIVNIEGTWVDGTSDLSTIVVTTLPDQFFDPGEQAEVRSGGTIKICTDTGSTWEIDQQFEADSLSDFAYIGSRVRISEDAQTILASGNAGVIFYLTQDGWTTKTVEEKQFSTFTAVSADLHTTGEIIFAGMPLWIVDAGEDEKPFGGLGAGRSRFWERAGIESWDDVTGVFRPDDLYRLNNMQAGNTAPQFGSFPILKNGFGAVGAPYDGPENEFGGLQPNNIGQVWIYITPILDTPSSLQNLQYWGSVVNV